MEETLFFPFVVVALRPITILIVDIPKCLCDIGSYKILQMGYALALLIPVLGVSNESIV